MGSNILTLPRYPGGGLWVGFQDSHRTPPGHAPAIFMRGGCNHPERRVDTGRPKMRRAGRAELGQLTVHRTHT